MPFVAFTCSCKCLFGRWKGNGEPLKHACPSCGSEVTDYCLPHTEGMTISPLRLPGDQYDYISPIDGAHVSSKRAHRDHLKRHGVIELGNEKPDLSKPLTPQIPREQIRAEIRNNVERMKSHGTWREV